MKVKDLQIGDRLVVEDEVWTIKTIDLDQFALDKAWISFDEPTGLGVFEAWPLDREVTLAPKEAVK